MTCRAVNLFIRCIRVAPVASCLFAGCTCSGGPGGSPPPTATATVITRPTQTPTSVPAPKDTPTPEVTPTAAQPKPDAAATATFDARRADCERYVAALSGRGQDRALLQDPAVQALAAQVPDLITCLAVKGDSQALCDPLVATLPSGQRRYSNQARDCIYSQSMFHEARTYPKGTSFMFPEIEWQQSDDPKFRDSLQEATRTGDEKKCAETGAFQSICRAYVKLDPSLCHVQGKLPKREDGGHSLEPAAAEEACKKTIESRKFLARGLQALAESGSPGERALAKAALGQADACTQYEGQAMDACLASPGAQVPGTPIAGTPVSGAAPPATPAPAGMPPPAGSSPGPTPA